MRERSWDKQHYRTPAGWQECSTAGTGGQPVAAEPQPVNPPAAVRSEPVSAPAVVQDEPRERRQDGEQGGSRRSWRKIALVAAVVILLVIIIAVVLVIFPGISGNSAENATAPDLPGALSSGIMPGKEPVINQATPVITDTPVKKK